MAACKTMGGADIVCSDKTSTLTQNKMFIVSIWNETLRTIGLAYKELNESEDLNSKDDEGVYDFEIENLTLIAIVEIKDILNLKILELF